MRDLIIKKVNARLKRIPKFANAYMVPFDRPGVHNWCLVEFWHRKEDDLWEPSAELEAEVLQIILDLDQEYDVAEKVIIRPIQTVEG